MSSKTEPASEAKERTEREARKYTHNCGRQFADKPSYIAGATAEYNRAQEEITRLKAELERERELRKEFAEWSKALISDVHFQERYPGVLNGLKNLLFKSIRERSIFKAKN